MAESALRRNELLSRLEESLGGPVRCIGTGPMETKRIGIVTGGAGGEIYGVAAEGIDTYITAKRRIGRRSQRRSWGLIFFWRALRDRDFRGESARRPSWRRSFRCPGSFSIIRLGCEFFSLG